MTTGGRRLMLTGIGLTALLALVAVASRAHKPGGGSGAAAVHPPQLIFEYLASIMVVLFPVVGILAVWGLAESRRHKVLAGERNWRRSLAIVLAITPFLVGAYFVVHHLKPGQRGPIGSVPTIPQPGTPGKARSPKVSLKPEPQLHFQWLAPLILGSLALGIFVTSAGMVALRRRHGDQWAEEAAMIEAVDEVLADTLDDLRAEQDARRAVIRTYARMERTFAAYGAPRHAFEAPQEYVARVLDRLGVESSSVRRVTGLYERAKFSRHEIDSGMKDEAIDALVGLRGELAREEEAA